MSIALMSQVWAYAPFDKTTLLVLLALADSAQDDGRCWPSISTIAQKARCQERWCRAVIAELEADGWIERHHRPGTSTLYRVIINQTPVVGTSPVDNAEVQPDAGRAAVGNRKGGSGEPKKHKNQKEPSKGSVRRTCVLPADFQVSPEMKAWALREHPSVNGQHETQKFVDYFRAKGTRYLDWELAWKNWIKRSDNVVSMRPAVRPAVPQRYNPNAARDFYAEEGIDYETGLPL